MMKMELKEMIYHFCEFYLCINNSRSLKNLTKTLLIFAQSFAVHTLIKFTKMNFS